MASVMSMYEPITSVMRICVRLKAEVSHLFSQCNPDRVANATLHPRNEFVHVPRRRGSDVDEKVAVLVRYFRIADAHAFHAELLNDPARWNPLVREKRLGHVEPFAKQCDVGL